MRGFSRTQFTDKEWGVHVVWTPIPKESPWGVLTPVLGTSWERAFPIVKKQDIEHALRGHTLPLLNSVGRDPKAWGKMVEGVCAERKTCPTFNAKTCFPCGKTPDCYSTPWEDPEFSLILTQIVLRWRDGEYVLIAT